MRRDDGFTLVELMVYILIGSIVTLAGTTVLLLGLRMNQQSSEVASRQNTARIVMQTLEDMAAEEKISLPPENTTTAWKVIRTTDSQVLFYYENNALYVAGSTVPILEDIEEASADWDPENPKLLKFSIKIDGQKYESSVYCRLIQYYVPAGEDSPAAVSVGEEAPGAVVLTVPDTDWELVSFARERQAFLEVLTAQVGSTGADVETGVFFSEWYIGGYEDNPGWNQETPWCACFLSWALEKCAGSLEEVPKFAHVDKFYEDFSLGYRKNRNPAPGDLIFFDWEVNAIAHAQHVGVVLKVEDGWIHTIEGNAGGQVAQKRYRAEDPYILGYGVLKWK